MKDVSLSFGSSICLFWADESSMERPGCADFWRMLGVGTICLQPVPFNDIIVFVIFMEV